MKTSLFLISIIIILAITAFTASSQANNWVQKNGYLENKTQVPPISVLKYTGDGKYILTYSGDSLVRKWDVATGNLINQYKIPINGIANLAFDYNDSIIAFSKQIPPPADYNLPDSVYIYVYNFLIDSNYCKISLEVQYGDPWGDYLTEVYGPQIVFNRKTNEIVTQFGFKYFSKGIDEYYGNMYVWNKYTGQLKTSINSGVPISILFSPDFNYLAVSSYTGLNGFEGQYYSETNDSLQIFDSNYKEKILLDTLAWTLAFTNDSKLLAAGTPGYKITLYNILNGPINSMQIGNDFYENLLEDIKFSPDSKYLIIGSKFSYYSDTSTICFWSIKKKASVESIDFPDWDAQWIIALSPDSVSFATGSSDGIIRIFKPKLMSKALQALFKSDITISNLNQPIKFIDLSTGNPTSWFWDFGDGITSTIEEPSHLYANSGKYSVKLVVRKNSLSDSTIYNDYITVQPNLKADFSADILYGDLPLTVSFTDKSIGNATSWLWRFGDGDSINMQNPKHIYNKPGIFPVTLIISDGTYSDTLTKWDYITVNQPPLNDTLFEKEKIIWVNNSYLKGIKGFQSISGGYIVESLTEGKNYILRLDINFDTLWTRSLFENIFHNPIQQVSNGTYYVIGNKILDTNNYTLNRMNESGEISIANSLDYRDRRSFNFDYIAENDNYYIITLENNTNGFLNYKTLVINKFDNYNKILWKGYNEYFGLGPYSFKCTFDSTNNFEILLYSIYTETDTDFLSKSLFTIKDTIFNTNEDNNLGDIVDDWDNYYLTDFKRINNNSYLFLENNNTIYRVEYQGNKPEIVSQKYLSQDTGYCLLPITPTTYIVSGSKNGHCWYAVMDTSGVMLEEHTLASRWGSFNSVSLNKDNSLLFVGSLYKNSIESGGIAVNGKGSEKLLDNQTGLYIAKTKPIKIVSVKETQYTGTDIQIFPNPASDELTIKYSLAQNDRVKINLYDALGQEIALLIDGDEDAGEHSEMFSVKNTNTGIYFCRILIGDKIFTKKIILIK
ncbi:MAG: PKD domain-containing protein [FCB group bacterium]|jgi:PKD repeat protein